MKKRIEHTYEKAVSERNNGDWDTINTLLDGCLDGKKMLRVDVESTGSRNGFQRYRCLNGRQ